MNNGNNLDIREGILCKYTGTDDEENALSTVNMQMEAFYAKAVNANILIYNYDIMQTAYYTIHIIYKYVDCTKCKYILIIIY